MLESPKPTVFALPLFLNGNEKHRKPKHLRNAPVCSEEDPQEYADTVHEMVKEPKGYNIGTLAAVHLGEGGVFKRISNYALAAIYKE